MLIYLSNNDMGKFDIRKSFTQFYIFFFLMIQVQILCIYFHFKTCFFAHKSKMTVANDNDMIKYN